MVQAGMLGINLQRKDKFSLEYHPYLMDYDNYPGTGPSTTLIGSRYTLI